jgi:hypothetical protein
MAPWCALSPVEDRLTVNYHRVIAVWRKQRMFGMSYFPLACAALAVSLVAVSVQAMPFSSHDSQLRAPNVTLVAEECPAGLPRGIYFASATPSLRCGTNLSSEIYLASATSPLRYGANLSFGVYLAPEAPPLRHALTVRCGRSSSIGCPQARSRRSRAGKRAHGPGSTRLRRCREHT